jgi:hypothetical protein
MPNEHLLVSDRKYRAVGTIPVQTSAQLQNQTLEQTAGGLSAPTDWSAQNPPSQEGIPHQVRVGVTIRYLWQQREGMGGKGGGVCWTLVLFGVKHKQLTS